MLAHFIHMFATAVDPTNELKGNASKFGPAWVSNGTHQWIRSIPADPNDFARHLFQKEAFDHGVLLGRNSLKFWRSFLPPKEEVILNWVDIDYANYHPHYFVKLITTPRGCNGIVEFFKHSMNNLFSYMEFEPALDPRDDDRRYIVDLRGLANTIYKQKLKHLWATFAWILNKLLLHYNFLVLSKPEPAYFECYQILLWEYKADPSRSPPRAWSATSLVTPSSNPLPKRRRLTCRACQNFVSKLTKGYCDDCWEEWACHGVVRVPRKKAMQRCTWCKGRAQELLQGWCVPCVTSWLEQ